MVAELSQLAHTMRSGNLEFTYYDSENDRDSDNVIVLVHGTGGSTASHFAWIFPMLSTKQRTYSIDLTMPEQVEAGSPLELDHLADQVITLLEHVRQLDRQVTVLGYSQGSPVLIRALSRRPELADRMVHLNGFIASDKQRQLRVQLWLHLYNQGDMEGLKEFNFWTAFSSGYVEAQNDAILKHIFDRQTFSRFSAAQMDLNSRIELTEEAKQLAHPSLIIGSAEDLMVPLRAQRLLFGHLENSRLTVIPTGHASVIERPAQVVFIVQEFLDHPDRYPSGSEIPVAKA